MSTENVEVFNKYYGNGVATQFSIGFPYLKREYVKVYLYRGDTSKEVRLNTNQFSFVNDATIQFPVLSTDEILKEGDIITIQRETELGSEFEFDNQRRLFPVEVMNADDLAFQQIQELSREIKRAVRVNPTAAETPEELLQTVYDKLDSATEIAGDAISAANQAQTAADNATAAVNSAEQTLVQTQAYVDSAKVEIDNTKSTAINTINSTVAQAKADVNSAIDEATTNISNIVSDAEGSITNIAVTEANKAIANAAQEATDTATANLNSYVDGTVKPSLQTYVDQSQEDANSAATSMEQAALSATAASNYASNASVSETNALSSKNAAASSATAASGSANNAKIWAEGTDSEVQGLGGVHSSKVWSETAQAVVAGKQDIATAVNYDNITNCITEIPQDIKLELNNGTLTLKAGSKVYVPNDKNADGSLKFDAVVIASDVVMSSISATTAQRMLFYNHSKNSFGWNNVENCLSGTATEQVSGKMYYNTSLNRIITNNNTASANYSLPICLFTAATTAGVVDSIDQVFNGFGYIGSTVFALPGVKGLIPNGRNADGSLRNIETTNDKVLTYTGSSLRNNASLGFSNLHVMPQNILLYDTERNINLSGGTNPVQLVNVATWSADSTGKITSFTPKTAFHAIDYNDSSTVSGWGMPSNRYISLTLGANGATYTAPANGWVVFAGKGQDGMHLANITNLMGYCAGNRIDGYISLSIPVINGNKFALYYGKAPTSNIIFRFIYAEGE